jgi:hypothetical protein
MKGRHHLVDQELGVPPVAGMEDSSHARATSTPRTPADLAGVHNLFRVDMTPDGDYYVFGTL